MSCLWDNPVTFNFVICGHACPVKANADHLSKAGARSSGFPVSPGERRELTAVFIHAADPAGRDAFAACLLDRSVQSHCPG